MTKGSAVLVSVLLLAGFSGCNQPKPSVAKAIPVSRLKMLAYQEEFGEYGFLNQVSSMVQDQEILYLSDRENSRVLKTDRDLNVLMQIGQKGEGPGELNLAGFLDISQDRLFVASGFAQRLAIYDLQGTFLDWVPVSNYILATRFAVFEDIIFISSSNKKQTITALDLAGEPLFQFCEPRFTTNPAEQKARNFKHLAITELGQQPVLVAVSLTEPIIELFTIDGERLATQSFEKGPVFRAALDRAADAYRADPMNRAKSYVLFEKIYILGGDLYANLYSSEPPHRILRFKLETDKITLEEILEIHDEISVGAFVVESAGRFYIYDAQSTRVQVYNASGKF